MVWLSLSFSSFLLNCYCCSIPLKLTSGCQAKQIFYQGHNPGWLVQALVDLIPSNTITAFQINGQFSTSINYGFYTFSIWKLFLLKIPSIYILVPFYPYSQVSLEYLPFFMLLSSFEVQIFYHVAQLSAVMSELL